MKTHHIQSYGPEPALTSAQPNVVNVTKTDVSQQQQQQQHFELSDYSLGNMLWQS